MIVLMLSSMVLESLGCECFSKDFVEEVAQSDYIFIGKVVEKYASSRMDYKFSISRVFKGNPGDTVTIRSGFGGGDCGMVFEIGEAYIVYSLNGYTSSCRKNELVANSNELGKLLYLSQKDFATTVGKSTAPLLTENEAQYFTYELKRESSDFNFYEKKVGFMYNSIAIDKQQYFEKWGGRYVVNQLIVLTEKEKQIVKGYDAIIVSWRKSGVSKAFRKTAIERFSNL